MKIMGVALALAVIGASPAKSPAQDVGIRDLLADSRATPVEGEQVFNRDLLLTMYARRSFKPWWNGDAPADVLEALDNAVLDGLNPDDYHARTIARLLAKPSSQQRVAALDVLCTDGLVQLAYDIRFGKMDQVRSAIRTPGLSSLGSGSQIVEIERILAMAASRTATTAIRSLRPDHFVYDGLAESLEHYRRVEANGGWPSVHFDLPLREGDDWPEVAQLRARLAIEGYLPTGNVDTKYDGDVVAAVKLFEHRHALNEDGVAGAAVQRELNIPVQARIRQIRVNMERARWVIREMPATFVAVNIAGAKVYLVRNDTVIFETRAIVGRDYRKTPLFTARLQYIDLNPSWTVPASIAPEVVAAAAKDPQYLTRNGFTVTDQRGRVVPSPVVPGGNAQQYTFRQAPGDGNPLGRVKFVFPNSHNVYLHDTPSRDLFDRENRTFSHGCIRVQNPEMLATLLMDDSIRWNRNAIEREIATGATTRIVPRSPTDITILYWTAAADLHGELHFYRDPYNRDRTVARILDATRGTERIR